MQRLQMSHPTGGGAATVVVTNCCANCVETPLQRLPPARGGTAQTKIFHLANWSGCCLPTLMTLVSGEGSPMFPLVGHQPASPSIWPAVQSLRRGLSTNPGVTMWCVCG